MTADWLHGSDKGSFDDCIVRVGEGLSVRGKWEWGVEVVWGLLGEWGGGWVDWLMSFVQHCYCV